MYARSKLAGLLYGMAIGDAYGYCTEFLSLADILSKWPNGPDMPQDNPILVTDDTQMALVVAKAMMNSALYDYEYTTMCQQLIEGYIKWLNDPQNNRAPGMTCLQACERLEKGLSWLEATNRNSKGCGANMRVAPLSLWANQGWSTLQIAQIAQLQAALTHGHPTALAAAEITAITCVKLLEGTSPNTLLEDLINYARNQQTHYYQAILQDLWDRPPFQTAEEFIALGWTQIAEVLDLVAKGLLASPEKVDPCSLTGEGWIAEESFATALLCFLWYPQEPLKAIRRAVITNGDSDSIACLVGAFCGAYHGIEAFPTDWCDRIEYQKDLEEIVDFLSN